MAEAKQEPCQVRSRTKSPCPRIAEAKILGVAFCGPCARRQEAYFAIGELTQQEEVRDLRSGSLVEALEKLRRDRARSTDLSLDADTVILAWTCFETIQGLSTR